MLTRTEPSFVILFSLFILLQSSMFKLNLKFISEDSVLVPYWMLRKHLLQSHLQVGNRTLSLYCLRIVIAILLLSSGPSPSSSLTPGPSLYTVGEEVLALWKQNRKYPATILRIQDDGCYLVRFYDGFEKTVRGQCIRRVGRFRNEQF